MKIVFASDSFKGSLSSKDICTIGTKVASKVFKDCEIVALPLADGGEGTVDCLIKTMNGKKVKCTVKDPLHNDIEVEYAIFEDNALMEMSAASGLLLVKNEDRDILNQSTYGTGEMIINALERGIKKIYIGLGGSATNDGGFGFASAIGVKFYDINGNVLKPLPINFNKIAHVDTNTINPLIKNANITVMCDVINPLLGIDGATYVFSKQKGATFEDIIILENGMKHYIDILEKTTNKTVRNDSGSGAAGGLASAIKLFTNSKICSGIDTILDLINFDNQIMNADIVITGEGCIDYQSSKGKVISGVAKRCKEKDIICIAFAGKLESGAHEMLQHGVSLIEPISNESMTLEYSINNARELYENKLTTVLLEIKNRKNNV